MSELLRFDFCAFRHHLTHVSQSDDSDKSSGPQKSELFRGPAHASPYAISRLSAKFDLVKTAEEIAGAETMVGAVTHGKLTQIAEQIRHLQAQAEAVLKEAKGNLDLHRAKCNFPRKVGGVYHLYLSASKGERFFSMVSKEEWDDSLPGEFLGTYRLELDQSFTRLA